MKKLDKLVANSLNPYTIVRITSSNTEEELDKIADNMVGFEDGLMGNDAIEIEISPVEAIVFINKNDLATTIKRLKEIGIKFEITNIVNEIFEMDNLDNLLSYFEIDEDPEFTAEFFPGLVSQQQKVINIINSIFENNFTMDDVLDRISTKGLDSLNEFHKNLLK